MNSVFPFLISISRKVHSATGICLLGDWEQNAPLTVDCAFPIDGSTWYRRCRITGKVQYWLPGYGGSEIGCWQTLRQADSPVEYAKAIHSFEG